MKAEVLEKAMFNKIAEKYNWTLTGEPTRLDGGLMHKMYKVDTQQGSYALKLLNPHVMRRETAMENFAETERIELILERQDIPILPALSFDGRKMQEIDGQYFYIFDYFPGRPLKSGEITKYHCGEMGKTLARIHAIDKRPGSAGFSEMSVDWDSYLAQIEKVNTGLSARLKEILPVLKESQYNGNLARRSPPQVVSICHNDMDRKNVLWNGNVYRVIDLECLSYNDPFTEILELALCWSGFEELQIDFGLFQAFLRGYKNAGGELPADWETPYARNTGRLEWLEYNIKRALGIDCGDDERELGTQEAEKTIQQIAYYSKLKKQLIAHCVI